jgi:hypothetical protein
MRRLFESIIFAVMARTFLLRLKGELAASSTPDPPLARIKESGRQIFDRLRGEQPDLQACVIAGICSLVLAGYRELLISIGSRERAQAVVGRAFSAMLGKWMASSVQLLVAMSRDPVRILSRLPMTGLGRWAWGKSMGFQQWSTNDSVFHVINRCAFDQFFTEQGEPQLTRLFCKCDAAWMNVINRSERPIRIDRPATISTGSATCQFIFTRDDPNSRRNPVDVVA